MDFSDRFLKGDCDINLSHEVQCNKVKKVDIFISA